VADTGPSWRANNNDNSLDIVPHHRANRVGESITEQVRWATGTGWACLADKANRFEEADMIFRH
jgi:hypothetical protein